MIWPCANCDKPFPSREALVEHQDYGYCEGDPDPVRPDRLFCGICPCGIVYADRYREVHGDYKPLAFLSYATLELDLEKDCPPDLAEMIRGDAATYQARAGEQFSISACGQTVLLGSARK